MMLPLRSTDSCVGAGWRRLRLVEDQSYLTVINSILMFMSCGEAYAELILGFACISLFLTKSR